MSSPLRNWRWGAWFAGILLGVFLLVAGTLHMAVRIRARRAVERILTASSAGFHTESLEYVLRHPGESLDYAVDEMRKAGSPRRERLLDLVQCSLSLISGSPDVEPTLPTIMSVEMRRVERLWREMRDEYPLSFNPW